MSSYKQMDQLGLVHTENKCLENEEFSEYGSSMRSKFLLDPNIVPLNHGAFGAVPKVVFEAYLDNIKQNLLFPDKQHYVTHEGHYREAVKSISEIVKCDEQDLAVCENATIGCNIVLRSFDWKQGDKILTTDVIYFSCGALMRLLEHTFEVEIIVVDVDVSNDTDDTLVAKFERHLQEPGIKACFMDHISSFPTIRFPLDRIIPLCKANGVASVIDGAHGVGLLDLDLPKLAPDFYISNLHKWYYVPPPCAFIYVDKKFHAMIQPLPMSYNFITEDQEDVLHKKFSFVGTKNYAGWFTIDKAKQFRESIGGDKRIWQYCQLLTDKVVDLFTAKWGPESIVGNPTSMLNVKPPFKYDMEKLSGIEFDHGTFLRKGDFKGDQLIRLSVNIYNTLNDYEKAIELVETCKQ